MIGNQQICNIQLLTKWFPNLEVLELLERQQINDECMEIILEITAITLATFFTFLILIFREARRDFSCSYKSLILHNGRIEWWWENSENDNGNTRICRQSQLLDSYAPRLIKFNKILGGSLIGVLSVTWLW